jgi:hypothetical protein
MGTYLGITKSFRNEQKTLFLKGKYLIKEQNMIELKFIYSEKATKIWPIFHL